MSEKQQCIPVDISEALVQKFIFKPFLKAKGECNFDLMVTCSQIELAYWCYLEKYAKPANGKQVYRPKWEAFVYHIFNHVYFLQTYIGQIPSLLYQFSQYKFDRPSYGAIILNYDMSKVLLVQGWKYTTWGFPGGKLEGGEQTHECAIREVYEETGFSISEKINLQVYISSMVESSFFNSRFRNVTLFIITGVSEKTKFEPKTKKEIRRVRWCPINVLPSGKTDEMMSKNDPRNPLKLSRAKCYTTRPFIKPLREWITKNKKYKNTKFNHFRSFWNLNSEMQDCEVENMIEKIVPPSMVRRLIGDENLFDTVNSSPELLQIFHLGNIQNRAELMTHGEKKDTTLQDNNEVSDLKPVANI